MAESILFEKIMIVNVDFNCEGPVYLGVDGGKIDCISETAPEKIYDRRIDGKNKVLLPALVNTHTHLPMTLLRGYAENYSLSDWLNKKVFPFEAKLTENDIYYGMLLAQAEMFRFGTVSTTEMYFRLGQLCRATAESGAKINVCNPILCFGSTDFENFSETKEYLELLQDKSVTADGRIIIDMGIHGEYTSNPVAVEKAADFAKEHGMRIQLHLSETKAEHEECKQRHGITPAAYFEKHGAFDVPCTAAHCVWLDDEDMEILARKGVTVANNPISNLKLASGIANVKKMMEKGINVALGTDGVASNNNLNLFEELKLFAVLNKAASGDPAFVTPAQALKAATLNGARSQGRDNCGVIKLGAAADLTVIDTDKPYMHPCHDLMANLVYSAQGTDVVMTVCDGRVLYENGEYKTVDVERAVYEVEKSAYKYANELK